MFWDNRMKLHFLYNPPEKSDNLAKVKSNSTLTSKKSSILL